MQIEAPSGRAADGPNELPRANHKRGQHGRHDRVYYRILAFCAGLVCCCLISVFWLVKVDAPPGAFWTVGVIATAAMASLKAFLRPRRK